MSAVDDPQPTPQKTAALAYAKRGWHVVPLHTAPNGVCSCGKTDCPSPGKHPRTINGLNSATCDPDDVDYFWDQHPDANIGIVAGPSKLAIVDLDSAEAIHEWKNLALGTPTLYAKTGKGMHLYYADPTGTSKPSAGGGIDLRAGASYVVAPPSVHANGTTYTWQNEDTPIAVAPLELVAWFKKRRADQAAATDGEPIPPGQRNNTLISLAGSARKRGHTVAEIHALLKAVNEERCNPPLGAYELQSLAARAGTWPIGSPELQDAIFWGNADIDNDPEAEPSATPLHSWMPVTLPFGGEPLEPTIAGIFFPGLTHELTGDSDTGKTMLLAALAIDEARSGYGVIWIDFEMGRRHFAKRLDELGVSIEEGEELVNDPATRRIFFLNPDQPVGPALLADLFHTVSDVPVRLLVVDAMTSAILLHSGDSNNDIDIDRIHQQLVKPFRERGIGVVIIDHPGKDAEKGTKGSIRKKQAVDVRYNVRATRAYKKGEGGTSTLDVKRDRTAELDIDTLRQFHLLPDGTWRFESGRQRGEFRPTHIMERVSRYLEAQTAGVSRRTVYSDVEGREEILKLAMNVLLEEKYITQKPGDRGSQLVSSTAPYRENDDPRSDTFLGLPLSPKIREPLKLDNLQTVSDENPSRETVKPSNHAGLNTTASTVSHCLPLSPGDSPDCLPSPSSLRRETVTRALDEPCPSCNTTLAASPHPTAGGTYCCHDCARGEACACKYLEAGQ